jgi:hypothetical protein
MPHDLLVYLGVSNTGFVALVTLRLYPLLKAVKGPSEAESYEADLNVLALTVLAVVNASQAFLNLFVVRENEVWIVGKEFDMIAVLDTVFSALDTAVVNTKLA